MIQLDHRIINITIAPAFRRIITLDDGVFGLVIVLGRMSVRRIITAPDVAAGSAEAQMNPTVTRAQAFFATERAGRDIADLIGVLAWVRHMVLRSAQSPD